MKMERKNIAEEIKRYRHQNNMSVPNLSKETGIPKERIYKWETGTVPYVNADYEKMTNLISGKFGKLERNKISIKVDLVIAGSNRIILEKVPNYHAPQQSTMDLINYLELFADALVQIYGLDRENVISIMGSIVGDVQQGTELEHNIL